MFKKIFILLLSLFLMCNVTFAQDKVEVKILDKKILHNDKQIQMLDINNTPIYPIITSNIDVYLPIRSISDILGKNITYDEYTKSIYIQGEKQPIINYNIIPLKNNDEELFAKEINTNIYLDNKLINEYKALSFNNITYVSTFDLYNNLLDYIHYDENSNEFILREKTPFTNFNLNSLFDVIKISFGLRYNQIDESKEAFKNLKNSPIPENYPYVKELKESLNQLEQVINKLEEDDYLSFSDFTIPFANLAILYTSKDYNAYLENIYGFKSKTISDKAQSFLLDDIEEIVKNLNLLSENFNDFKKLKNLTIPKNLKYNEKIINNKLNNIIDKYKKVLAQLKNYNKYLNKNVNEFIPFENELTENINTLYHNIEEYNEMFEKYYEFFQSYFML